MNNVNNMSNMNNMNTMNNMSLGCMLFINVIYQC